MSLIIVGVAGVGVGVVVVEFCGVDWYPPRPASSVTAAPQIAPTDHSSTHNEQLDFRIKRHAHCNC
eukprot:6470721-Amphidinium_carterae.1